MKPERLSKIMARRGLCSRREADCFIEQGLVFVDGARVNRLGTKIDPESRIELADEARTKQETRMTILLNKPVGYVSGQPEGKYPPAVALIAPSNRWEHDPSTQNFSPAHLEGLAPAGRLDVDSHGLLVLTQDGRVARRLIGADSEIDKEYRVRVKGRVTDGTLAKLRHGLRLDGRKLKPARIEKLRDDRLRFVLREGRKRQIRRMCGLVDLEVLNLKRVRIGRVALGRLPSGRWRYLGEQESFRG